jgi:hypothetical protein
MPIPVSCQCGQTFRAKDDLAGKRVKCPKCGQPLQIPGANPSDSMASASGLLSIDDLMKMDAAAPAGPMPGMPGVPQGAPGMPQGMPGQMPAGGYVPPGAGGFQAPNPFFAQPGARPRSSGGGEQGFKVAMLALGGIGGLAVIAMVLIFVLRDSGSGDTTSNVASNTPTTTGPATTPGTTTPGTTTPGTTTPGTATPGTTTPGATTPGTTTPGTTLPGTTTPGTTIPGTSTPGTSTPNTGGNTSPRTFVHAGYDTPEAAVDGFLNAIEREDVNTARDIIRDILGSAWPTAEKQVDQKAKAQGRSVDEVWRDELREAKGQLKRSGPAQLLGADRAFVPWSVTRKLEGVNIDPELLKRQLGALCLRDARGKWHMGMDELQQKVLLASFGGGGGTPTVSGPALAAGLKQYYAQQKDLRGAWLVEDDDQPHMGWGWMTELLPYIGHSELHGKLDFKKQFYLEPNRELANTVIPQFLNPADSRRQLKELSLYQDMAVSHFAGVSGIEDRRQVVAAALPRSDPRAGVFGYDRIAKPSEITDGTSSTIMLIGVEMPRPWIEGGGATIRGAREPYFGGVTGSQFGTRGQRGAIVLMADGSVRLIPSSVDPKVFRNLCTIHGGETVDMAPYTSKEDFFGAPAVATPAKAP